MAFNENFYIGYRRNIVKFNEVLVSLLIPFLKPNQHFVAYKQSRRRNNDIDIVNMAFSLDLNVDLTVKKIRISVGGMGPTTRVAGETANALKNRPFNRDLVELAISCLVYEFSQTLDVPKAMVKYRETLVISFFFKFFLTVKKLIGGFYILDLSPF